MVGAELGAEVGAEVGAAKPVCFLDAVEVRLVLGIIIEGEVGLMVGAELGAEVGAEIGDEVGGNFLFSQKGEEDGTQLQTHINPENRAAKKNMIVNSGIMYNFLLLL